MMVSLESLGTTKIHYISVLNGCLVLSFRSLELPWKYLAVGVSIRGLSAYVTNAPMMAAEGRI